MLSRYLDITPRPCGSCPLRTDHTITPRQRSLLAATTGADADPYRCDSPDPADTGKVCTAWLVTAWRGNRQMIEAVRDRRILLAWLMVPLGWPALHPTLTAALGAATPLPGPRAAVDDASRVDRLR